MNTLYIAYCICQNIKKIPALWTSVHSLLCVYTNILSTWAITRLLSLGIKRTCFYENIVPLILLWMRLNNYGRQQQLWNWICYGWVEKILKILPPSSKFQLVLVTQQVRRYIFRSEVTAIGFFVLLSPVTFNRICHWGLRHTFLVYLMRQT